MLSPDRNTPHRVVSREEWLRARKAHLKNEKSLTHLRDLGIPVLNVWSKTQGDPWLIPLFLSQSDLLYDALRESAGETHPVTIAVANRD